jgi:hypothetical protein
VGTSSFLFRDLGSNIYFLTYSHLRKSSLLESAFSFRSVSSVVPLRKLFSDISAFQAAKDVSTSQGKLVKLFSRIGYYLFRRPEIYTGVSPTTAMADINVEIMVKVLGSQQRKIHRGRLSVLVSRRFYDSVASAPRSRGRGSYGLYCCYWSISQ